MDVDSAKRVSDRATNIIYAGELRVLFFFFLYSSIKFIRGNEVEGKPRACQARRNSL